MMRGGLATEQDIEDRYYDRDERDVKNSVKGSMHGSSSSRISAQINAAFASGIMAPLQSTAAVND